MIEENQTPRGKQVIALIGFDDALSEAFTNCDFKNREIAHFANGLKMASAWTSDGIDIVAYFE